MRKFSLQMIYCRVTELQILHHRHPHKIVNKSHPFSCEIHFVVYSRKLSHYQQKARASLFYPHVTQIDEHQRKKGSTAVTSWNSNFPRSHVRMFRIFLLTNTAVEEVKWKIACVAAYVLTHDREEREQKDKFNLWMIFIFPAFIFDVIRC